MAEFRDSVLNWISLLPTLGNWYFLVVAFTSLSAAYHSSHSASHSSHSASAPSPSATCDLETLIVKLYTFIGWAITLMISTYLLFYFVKSLLDTTTAIETKLSSIESEAYKAVSEELEEAAAALKSPELSTKQLSNQQAARRRRDVASTKAERWRPKEGLKRLSASERKWIRLLVIISILFSFVTGVFAALAFYTSLQMRLGCNNGFAQVGPFVLVGTIFLGFHLQALQVAYYAY